jgi:hypothetical protein
MRLQSPEAIVRKFVFSPYVWEVHLAQDKLQRKPLSPPLSPQILLFQWFLTATARGEVNLEPNCLIAFMPARKKSKKHFMSKSTPLAVCRGHAADKWLEEVANIRADCFDPTLIRTRIKIAILDTGIDYDHIFFSDDDKMPRLVARESFLSCSDPNSVKDSPRNTKDTHGRRTHIAGIILQVALDADLYIGRVLHGDEPTQDDAQQISKVRSNSFIAKFLHSRCCFLDRMEFLTTNEGHTLGNKSRRRYDNHVSWLQSPAGQIK